MHHRFPVALLLAMCACTGSEAFVATPTSITLSPTSLTFGALASSHLVTAAVLDQRGDPIRGAAVVWTSDSQSIAAVNASGLVKAQAVGSTKIRATVPLTNGTVVASAAVSVSQVPAHFLKFAGDLQIDTVSGTLPTPVTVQVTDSNAQPIPGIVVSFAVTSGGGHLSSTADTTDATGRASALWTLGGAAGPNALSASAAITISGSPMTFTAGSFGLVIEHEMGHVLGFGTIWQSKGLLVNPSGCDTTQDPHFVGSQALTAFDRIGGVGYVASAKVPVENKGGPGTCDGHWREKAFRNELMTGFLNVGSNPLSLETVASMGDLGYLVTYSAADPYVLSLALQAEPSQVIMMGNDVLPLPIVVLDRAGQVVGTIPPRR